MASRAPASVACGSTTAVTGEPMRSSGSDPRARSCRSAQRTGRPLSSSSSTEPNREPVSARQRRLAAVGHARHRPLGQREVAHPRQAEALERGPGADELGDEGVGRVGQDALGGVELGDDRLLAQDRDAVAHLDRLVDVVGDEDDGLADVLLQAQELVLQLLAGDGVDRPERLVHEHHRRVGREGPGDADALALPAGQLLGVATAVDRRVHADEVEHLVDAGLDPVAAPLEQLRDRRDVLRDRQVREQPDLLDDVADAPAQLVRRAVGDVLALEPDDAARRLDDAVDHLHGRRLAAAGRTDEHDDLALRDDEVELAHGGLGLSRVALGEPLERDHRGAGCGHRIPLEVVRRASRRNSTSSSTR